MLTVDKYLLFICKSALTGRPVFLFAEPGSPMWALVPNPQGPGGAVLAEWRRRLSWARGLQSPRRMRASRVQRDTPQWRGVGAYLLPRNKQTRT